MTCDKCDSGGKRFCPVTIGLALGLTCALLSFFSSAWALLFGAPHYSLVAMLAHDWREAGIFSVLALLRGFVGGFVFGFIYNFMCCCKSQCCGKCSCCEKTKK